MRRAAPAPLPGRLATGRPLRNRWPRRPWETAGGGPHRLRSGSRFPRRCRRSRVRSPGRRHQRRSRLQPRAGPGGAPVWRAWRWRRQPRRHLRWALRCYSSPAASRHRVRCRTRIRGSPRRRPRARPGQRGWRRCRCPRGPAGAACRPVGCRPVGCRRRAGVARGSRSATCEASSVPSQNAFSG